MVDKRDKKNSNVIVVGLLFTIAYVLGFLTLTILGFYEGVLGLISMGILLVISSTYALISGRNKRNSRLLKKVGLIFNLFNLFFWIIAALLAGGA